MSYEDIFTLIVDLCTIAAFVIAFVAWKNWKKQQNYSLYLDKIFAYEIALNAYFSFELALVEIKLQHADKFKYAHIGWLAWLNKVPDLYKSKFRNKAILNKIQHYNAALSALEVLEIKFDKAALRNAAYYEHEITQRYIEADQAKTVQQYQDRCKLIERYIHMQMAIALKEVKNIQKSI